MRKKYCILALAISSLSFLFSCQKDLEMKTDSEQANEKLVRIENGNLVFKDGEAFSAISMRVDAMSTARKNQWEDSLGFRSSRYYYSEALDEREDVKDNVSLKELMNKYEGKVAFKADYSIEDLYEYPEWASYINLDGVVIIGESIYKFTSTKQIIITDGDMAKIGKALELNTSDENEGILIYNKLNLPMPNLSLSNVKISIGDLILEEGYWKWTRVVDHYVEEPVIYSGEFFSERRYNGGHKRLTVTLAKRSVIRNNVTIYVSMKSERKGMFGWFKNKTNFVADKISQTYGYNQADAITEIGGGWLALEERTFGVGFDFIFRCDNNEEMDIYNSNKSTTGQMPEDSKLYGYSVYLWSRGVPDYGIVKEEIKSNSIPVYKWIKVWVPGDDGELPHLE